MVTSDIQTNICTFQFIYIKKKPLRGGFFFIYFLYVPLVKTYRDVDVSNNKPTGKARVWVNTASNDTESQDILLPQVDDNNVSDENTWSSKKIDSEIGEVREGLDNKTDFVLKNYIDVENDVLVDMRTNPTGSQMLENQIVPVAPIQNVITTKPILLKAGTYYIRASYSSLGNILTWVYRDSYPVGTLNELSFSDVGVTRVNSSGVDIIEYVFKKDYDFWLVINAQKSNGLYKDTLMISDVNFLGSDVVVPYNKTGFLNCIIQDQVDSNTLAIERLGGTSLNGKRIAYFGDSLMYGMELNGNGYTETVVGGIWKRLNETYELNMVTNQSEGGTTIQNVGNNKSSISYKMANYDATDTDILLFTGGINDWYALSHLIGYSIGEVDLSWGGYLTTDDYSTIVNSLETAFRHLKKSNNKDLRIVWIKPWRTVSVDSTMVELFDKIESACHKYGVPVCDLFNNVGFALMNPSDKQMFGRHNYTSETNYEIDGTHVNGAAYDRITKYIAKFLIQLF